VSSGVRQTQTLIVGGGLSGLATAVYMNQQQHSFDLLEGRDRLGGRIRTARLAGGRFDLGPAWFWEGQPRVLGLIDAIGAKVSAQYADGEALYEIAPGDMRRIRGAASMAGSWRVDGGMGRLVEGLAQSLPAAHIHLSAQVTSIDVHASGVRVGCANGAVREAERVVLAMPPRLIAGIRFDPALPPSVLDGLRSVPTWMAGQAKVMAVYDRPFWRDHGLSGDAISRVGPLVEIHDASDEDAGRGALFGFVGVPASARADADALKTRAVEQLARLFGEAAAAPLDVALYDWAQDPLTAVAADRQPMTVHPHYDAIPPLVPGRVFVAGTEASPEFGGYLEGALTSAQRVLSTLTQGETTAG